MDVSMGISPTSNDQSLKIMNESRVTNELRMNYDDAKRMRSCFCRAAAAAAAAFGSMRRCLYLARRRGVTMPKMKPSPVRMPVQRARAFGIGQ